MGDRESDSTAFSLGKGAHIGKIDVGGLALLKGAGAYPAPQCPCGMIERRVAPASGGCSQVRDHLRHIRLAAVAIATHRPVVSLSDGGLRRPT